MSESQFGGPPINGKGAWLKPGNPHPTPFHVEVWINGELSETKRFATQREAESFQRKVQRKEVTR